jgi:hypothetical protein
MPFMNHLFDIYPESAFAEMISASVFQPIFNCRSLHLDDIYFSHAREQLILIEQNDHSQVAGVGVNETIYQMLKLKRGFAACKS